MLLQVIQINFPTSGETLLYPLRYQSIRFFLHMCERKIDVFPVWRLSRTGMEIPWDGALLECLFSLSFFCICIPAALWFFPSQLSSGRCVKRRFLGQLTKTPKPNKSENTPVSPCRHNQRNLPSFICIFKIPSEAVNCNSLFKDILLSSAA